MGLYSDGDRMWCSNQCNKVETEVVIKNDWESLAVCHGLIKGDDKSRRSKIGLDLGFIP